jgi:hypothetical protein
MASSMKVFFDNYTITIAFKIQLERWNLTSYKYYNTKKCGVDVGSEISILNNI